MFNGFSAIKGSLSPVKVQEVISSSNFNAQVDYKVKSTKGKIECNMCVKSPLISKDDYLIDSYKINLNSKALEIDDNGKVIRVPMKLIWGFIAIITSILDVCEKISDLIAVFGIRFESQLKKFSQEVKSSVTIDGKTILELENWSRSDKPSGQVIKVTMTRHGRDYTFHTMTDVDLNGIMSRVLKERYAEFGWYTVKVDHKKSFRFLYSSK